MGPVLGGLVYVPMTTKADLQVLGAICHECPLQHAPGPICHEPAKDLPKGMKRIAFVGERPGPVELGSGRPFAGDTGYFINNIFKDLGLERSWVDINNALPCWDYSLSDSAASAAVAHCRARLLAQVKEADLIIAAGDRAIQALLGFAGVWNWRGYPQPAAAGSSLDRGPTLGTVLPLGAQWVFPVHHPTYILREPSILPIFDTDMRRAKAFIEGDLPLYDWPPSHITEDENTWAALMQLKRRLDAGHQTLLSYDVENLDAGNIFTDPLLCHGIAWDEPFECAASLPWPGQWPALQELFLYCLKHPNARLVCQNGNHDKTVAPAKGIELAKVEHDTLQMARVLYFQWPKKDLGTLASTLLWRPRHKSMFHVGDDRKGSKAFGRAPMAELLLYNSRDNHTQLAVARVMLREMGLA